MIQMSDEDDEAEVENPEDCMPTSGDNDALVDPYACMYQ